MIAIIPARAGSKGLPGKNIRKFLGIPLIAHTIEAARESSSISRVVVSTDGEEIASVAQLYGAEVPFRRPAELSSDEASSRGAVLHAIEMLERSENRKVAEFCVLQATSPLRSSEDIERAVAVFRTEGADSVVSVCEFEHPVQWALELRERGRLHGNQEMLRRRRQELTGFVRPNGAIYVLRTESFRRTGSFVGGNAFGYLMPKERSFDIDTEADFVAAEAVGRHLNFRVR